MKFSGTTAFVGNSGNYKICNAPASTPQHGVLARTRVLIDRIRAEQRATAPR